jgi:glucose/arabinose dehydrogenase
MTGMYEAPDGRFFVTEQAGRIRVFDNKPNVAQASVFLDISDRVFSVQPEEGLLGLAFAPDFTTSGKFYVDYVADKPLRTVIARFSASPGADAADKASEERILEINQPFPNHKGGQVVFGPDGFLYIGLGDGGSGNDPMKNGQNLNVLLAKILRIDVSGAGNGLAYRIPADNPFAGKSGNRGEIWAYGLRNPWRFSFDRQTGDLWVGDVGQNAFEEIAIVTKGGNYGWSVMEGNQCLGGGRSCDASGLTPPIFDYPTGENCAITGGFVYRGSAIPRIQGAYIYGDYCSGRIWGLRYNGRQVTAQAQLIDSPMQISSFATDHDGNIYALAYATSGGIFRIVER